MENTLHDLIVKNFRFLYYCAAKYYPPNSQDIDDVVQDSVIKMHKFYDKDKFSRNWMGQVVSSVALTKLRAPKRNVNISEEQDEYLELLMSLNDESFSREYKDYLLRIMKLSIELLDNDLHKSIIKKKLEGKVIKKMDIENVSIYKINQNYSTAMQELKRISNELLEVFEY